MILDTQTIDELKNEITALFRNSYEVLTDKAFEVFLFITISDLIKELEHIIKIEKPFITSIITINKKTKKRIHDKIESEINLIGTDKDSKIKLSFVKAIRPMYYLYSTYTSDFELKKLNSLYNADNFETFKNNCLKEIYAWVYDDNNYISSSHEYLSGYSINQIEKYFEKDIRLAFYKLLMDKKTNKMSIVSKTLSEIPVDHTNKRKIKNVTVDNKMQDIYIIDDEKLFESVIDSSEIIDGVFRESISKIFNLLDIKVIQYLISVADKDFFYTRKVSCDLGDIVGQIYPSKGKKDYIAVKNSILKINLYKCIIIDKKIRQKPYSIFEASIDKALNSDKELVVATFSEAFINDLIKNGPISVYEEIVKNYKLNSSQILVYALQRERYALINENKEPLMKSFTYAYFLSVMYLARFNKSGNVKLIEKSLSEIKESGIVLKDFSRKGDIFFLEFIPFSLKEKNDLAYLIQSFSIKIADPVQDNSIILSNH